MNNEKRVAGVEESQPIDKRLQMILKGKMRRNKEKKIGVGVEERFTILGN